MHMRYWQIPTRMLIPYRQITAHADLKNTNKAAHAVPKNSCTCDIDLTNTSKATHAASTNTNKAAHAVSTNTNTAAQQCTLIQEVPGIHPRAWGSKNWRIVTHIHPKVPDYRRKAPAGVTTVPPLTSTLIVFSEFNSICFWIIWSCEHAFYNIHNYISGWSNQYIGLNKNTARRAANVHPRI